jgi:hypothetical protein
VSVLQGGVTVAGDTLGEPLRIGQTMLIPASIGPVELTPGPNAELLDMYLP